MRQMAVSVTESRGANALAPRVDEIEHDFEYQRERLEPVSVEGLPSTLAVVAASLWFASALHRALGTTNIDFLRRPIQAPLAH